MNRLKTSVEVLLDALKRFKMPMNSWTQTLILKNTLNVNIIRFQHFHDLHTKNVAKDLFTS